MLPARQRLGAANGPVFVSTFGCRAMKSWSVESAVARSRSSIAAVAASAGSASEMATPSALTASHAVQAAGSARPSTLVTLWPCAGICTMTARALSPTLLPDTMNGCASSRMSSAVATFTASRLANFRYDDDEVIGVEPAHDRRWPPRESLSPAKDATRALAAASTSSPPAGPQAALISAKLLRSKSSASGRRAGRDRIADDRVQRVEELDRAARCLAPARDDCICSRRQRCQRVQISADGVAAAARLAVARRSAA